MALFEKPSTTASIKNLLAAERKHLISGDIEKLSGFADEKERLLVLLEKEHPQQSDIAALKSAAERNQSLLSAAETGIKSALKRIDSMRKGPGPMRTYARDGGATEIGSPGRPGINRRA